MVGSSVSAEGVAMSSYRDRPLEYQAFESRVTLWTSYRPGMPAGTFETSDSGVFFDISIMAG